ncbi:aminotransferase class I/II-fold pyridoxal phosphate-dependent enzyme [Streptomyces sp. YGL11-2]|uniref:aminotransferase class I/II-fold pyridoxal phosphate-dependent enzyme n=1 Tax=Streptomyces sp. YGL11-2 TaxID=3414028 RepID=UPI003CF67803
MALLEISKNWLTNRLENTTDALALATERDLTSHVFHCRRGKVVELADGSEAVEFVSCSYLGLEVHPQLLHSAKEAIDRAGVHFASARTRMRLDDLEELESILDRVYGLRSVTAFTSVGNVHLGVLPLLAANALPSYPVAEAGPVFLVDRTAHASIQVLRGIFEQIGPVSRFDAHDTAGLGALLDEAVDAGRTPIVLVDGIGSMGGLIDVVELNALTAAAGGYLYVDDAHGISIAGPQGGGYAHEAFGADLPDSVILVGSLSKAFGGAGGFGVLRDRADTKVLRKFGNPLIFGGPIALPMVSANLASARLHLNGAVVPLQDRLWQNTELFDQHTYGRLVNAGERSPVRGAAFAAEADALAAAERLRKAGILVTPAFYPTVARGTGLVRFAVSALHTDEQIARAAEALGELD